MTKPTKDSLKWLRTASLREIEQRLDDSLAALAEGNGPNLAERRLWERELRDRDDADQLQDLIDRIRASFRRSVGGRSSPKSDQGSLF